MCTKLPVAVARLVVAALAILLDFFHLSNHVSVSLDNILTGIVYIDLYVELVESHRYNSSVASDMYILPVSPVTGNAHTLA
jgi:hypothetical protein